MSLQNRVSTLLIRCLEATEEGRRGSVLGSFADGRARRSSRSERRAPACWKCSQATPRWYSIAVPRRPQ
eukprot:10929239-Karenia_brevis.AAC.1